MEHPERASIVELLLGKLGFLAGLLAACGLTAFLLRNGSTMPTNQTGILLFLAWIALIFLGLLQDALHQERRVRGCQRWRKFGGGEEMAWHLDLYFYSAVVVLAASLFCWMAIERFGEKSKGDPNGQGKVAASGQVLQLKMTQSAGETGPPADDRRKAESPPPEAPPHNNK